MEFKVGQTIKINNKEFSITKVEVMPDFIGGYEIHGMLEGEPAFLGSRRVFTRYFTKRGKGFRYNWNA